jgi:hypothetical protein
MITNQHDHDATTGNGEKLDFGIDYSVYSGSVSAELEMANVVNPMMTAAAATVSTIGNHVFVDYHHDIGDDVLSQISKLSEETVQLEQKLGEALAQKALAELKRSQLEQHNTLLKGVQGVAVL